MIFDKKRNATVIQDEVYSHRWLGIFGESQKFELQNSFPADDTTGDPTQFNMTVVEVGTGTTTAVNALESGAAMLITTAANEYDGINLQAKGEQFKLEASKPFYFGAKLKISDATQSDLFIGMAETDTTLMATSTAHAIALGGDGAFFAKLDGSTTAAAEMYLDGSETATADYGSAIDTDYIVYEIEWDGETCKYYIDGVLVTCVKASLGDGDLTPSINFRAGAAAAVTCTVAWIRAYQAN